MRPVRFIRDLIHAVFATAGIRLDKLHPHRIVLIVANIALLVWALENTTVAIALTYFLTVFTLRYLFLFASFIPDGIAGRLIRCFGEEKGYEIYETITATMFFHGGAAFGCLLESTRGMPFGAPADYPALLAGTGTILSAVGSTVNIWATLIIGVDIYYYKDLFLGRFITEFRMEGPYRIFSNPMYGVGQLAAYGAALAGGSLAGIIATMMNQTMMYIFYFLIEKPHIRRMLASAEETGKATQGDADDPEAAEGLEAAA